MYVQTDRDLIIARGATIPGAPLPRALRDRPLDGLRYDGGSVIDPGSRTSWAIDALGRKRLPEMADPDWPVVSCTWSAALVRGEDGAWHVESDQERWLRAQPTLDEDQWHFLLDRAGLRAALGATLAGLPTETEAERNFAVGLRQVAAGRKGADLGITLRLVSFMRAAGLPEGVEAPSDEDLIAAWSAAAQFRGAASLFGGAS